MKPSLILITKLSPQCYLNGLTAAEIDDGFGVTEQSASKNNKKQRPIYGMPVLDVEKCKLVLLVIKSLSQSYTGIDNDLFY
jgi:hypothetical protein